MKWQARTVSHHSNCRIIERDTGTQIVSDLQNGTMCIARLHRRSHRPGRVLEHVVNQAQARVVSDGQNTQIPIVKTRSGVFERSLSLASWPTSNVLYVLALRL